MERIRDVLSIIVAKHSAPFVLLLRAISYEWTSSPISWSKHLAYTIATVDIPVLHGQNNDKTHTLHVINKIMLC